MNVLYLEKIQSLIVEGGSILLQSFINANCWDEAYIEYSDARLNDGVKAPELTGDYDFLTLKKFGKVIKYASNKTFRQENEVE